MTSHCPDRLSTSPRSEAQPARTAALRELDADPSVDPIAARGRERLGSIPAGANVSLGTLTAAGLLLQGRGELRPFANRASATSATL